MDLDSALDDLAALADEAAAEVGAATEEIRKERSDPSPPSTPAAPSESVDKEPTAAEQPSPEQLDEAIASTVELPSETKEDAQPGQAPLDPAIAEPDREVRQVADLEIEEFLSAAAAGEAKQKKTAASAEVPTTDATDATDAEGETPPPAPETAEGEKSLKTRMIAGLARVVEFVLLKLNRPVAGIREDIKVLIGYLAIGTFVMGLVAWVVAMLR